jgi:hypothetical protein
MHWPKLEHQLFPGQQANEKIYLIIRQHWFVLAYKLFAWFLFVAVLIVGDFLVGKYLPGVLVSPYVEFYTLFKTLYTMCLLLGLLIVWIMYYLNVQIVTNERVVDITQTSLLHHTISELHLSNLQDVTGEVKGFFPTFLNYGDVFLQTAGESKRFEFCLVPNPTAVEKLILDLYEQLTPEQKAKKAE